MNLRSWFARAMPAILGTEYTKCTPVIAGSNKIEEDIVGRTLDWDAPPKDAVFYNVTPDFEAVKKYDEWELDYVLGNSDAAQSDRYKLTNGTMIYWAPVPDEQNLRIEDPIVVQMSATHKVGCLDVKDPAKVNEEWLCLRRVGAENGDIFTKDGKVIVRSINTETNEVEIDYIDNEAVQGIVFGSYNPEIHRRISVAANLPLEPIN